jgi:hypothetical protein
MPLGASAASNMKLKKFSSLRATLAVTIETATQTW